MPETAQLYGFTLGIARTLWNLILGLFIGVLKRPKSLFYIYLFAMRGIKP